MSVGIYPEGFLPPPRKGTWNKWSLVALDAGDVYGDEGIQGPSCPLGSTGDTGELRVPQAVQLWDPTGLGCSQEGHRAPLTLFPGSI